MAIQFPNSPSNGQTFTATNGLVYRYDGEKWITTGSAQVGGAAYVDVTGDTMTGQLVLPGGGTGLEAATVDQVDAAVVRTGDTMTGDLTVPSLNGGQLAGFRNQLINGDMLIGQRGVSDVVDWTADRWRGINTAVRYYVSEQGQFRRSIGPLANGTNIVQPIELQFTGSRGVFQEGSQWTFSLYAVAAAPAAALYFSTASFNGTILLETTFTLAATGESEGNLSRWSGTVTLPSGSIASSTCLVLSIAVQNGERFVGCQLEPGPVATPFEHRTIGTELALCQRYYQTFADGPTFTKRNDDTINGNRALSFMRSVTMRTSPSETGSLIGGGNLLFTDSNATIMNATADAGAINQTTKLVNYTADAEL